MGEIPCGCNSMSTKKIGYLWIKSCAVGMRTLDISDIKPGWNKIYIIIFDMQGFWPKLFDVPSFAFVYNRVDELKSIWARSQFIYK